MSTTRTPAQIRAENEAFLDSFQSNAGEGRRKHAADTLDAYTKIYMREDGIQRRVLPNMPVSNEDLSDQLDTDKPVLICYKETYQPPSVSVPFASNTLSWYIRGNKYRITSARTMSRRYQKDVSELRNYPYDIREDIIGNAAKDLQTTEDEAWFDACNAAVLQSSGANTPNPDNGGVANYVSISGPVSRESLEESKKVMPRGISRREVSRVVVNNIFIKEIEKFGRDEMGGDLSEQLIRKGFAVITDFLGIKEWFVTIKQELVGDSTIWQYSDPEWLGKQVEFQAPTSHIAVDMFMIEFQLYEECGGAIANSGAVARVDFE